MAAFYSLVLFLFSMAFQLMNPSASASASASKCNKSFVCGKLGSLEFPFSESSECGLFLVNCTTSPPRLQLGAAGYSLELHTVNLAKNTCHVVDTEHQKLLNQSNCFSFFNRSLPDSPLASFDVRPSVTFLGCPKPLEEQAVRSYFEEYRSYKSCTDLYLYYGYHPKAESSRIPYTNCSMYHLPARPNYRISEPLFSLLSSEFDLHWNVSTDCLSCHRRGGQCVTDSSNQFQCQRGAKSKLKIAALAAGISVGAVLLIGLFVAVLYYIYRRRKIATNAYLLSRNIALLPSAKSDIDGANFIFGIPIFSYEELEEATNNFDPLKELGDGGFGTVYYGKLRDGREVAIKRLYEHNCRRMEQFMNEINILTCLRHPNLVSLYGCTSRRSRELLLVYEYIPNGTVADHLYGDRAHEAALPWPIRMNIAVETASALAYLHRSEIMHRDIKTTNILLDNNFSVKVADFGLSKLFPGNVTHVTTAPQGTPGYVDPEYHQCYQLTNKSDVYSFGVVLIELISSMPAVDITRHRHEINLANLALDRIQRCAFDELMDLSLGYKTDAEVARMTTSVAELAFRCLQFDGEMRPSMVEVLDFLKELQAGGGSDVGSTKVGDGNCSISPEMDGVVLLKKNRE